MNLRIRGGNHRVVLAIFILVSVLLDLGCTEDDAASGNGAAKAAVVFFGKIIDQNGRPVSGATVSAEIFELRPGMMAGEPIVERSTMKPRSAISDGEGRFTVTIPAGFQVLEISNVAKPGYGWVHDWMWSGGALADIAQHSNRSFYLAGNMAVARTYLPDRDRPAIYPLHVDGAPGPVERPSRGGSDRDPSGKVTRNQPVQAVLPSAGPDSPGDDYQAILDAIVRVSEERASAATRPRN